MLLALMGVSLAWLMSTPARSGDAKDRRGGRDVYPLATVTGSLQRTRPAYTGDRRSYSEFIDDVGKQLKALTEEIGRRVRGLVDGAGQYFRGFVDSTGRRIDDIRDETGVRN